MLLNMGKEYNMDKTTRPYQTFAYASYNWLLGGFVS